nr:hypothetical protein Iba_chr06bCG4710 [Ipomoea batatas]
MWSLKTRRGDNHPWKMVAQELQMASTAKLLMTPGQGSPRLAANGNSLERVFHILLPEFQSWRNELIRSSTLLDSSAEAQGVEIQKLGSSSRSLQVEDQPVICVHISLPHLASPGKSLTGLPQALHEEQAGFRPGVTSCEYIQCVGSFVKMDLLAEFEVWNIMVTVAKSYKSKLDASKEPLPETPTLSLNQPQVEDAREDIVAMGFTVKVLPRVFCEVT